MKKMINLSKLDFTGLFIIIGAVGGFFYLVMTLDFGGSLVFLILGLGGEFAYGVGTRLLGGRQ